MKRVMLIALCAVVLAACSQKGPKCDAENTTVLLTNQFWNEFASIFSYEGFGLVNDILTVYIRKVETVESDNLRSLCKAEFTLKVTNSSGLRALQKKAPWLSASDLEGTQLMQYSIMRDTDEKSFKVNFVKYLDTSH